MKEEQRNLTLGQVADMKQALEENIKNQLTDFMNQTGVEALQVDAWCGCQKEIGKNDTVETKVDSNVRINIMNFLNR